MSPEHRAEVSYQLGQLTVIAENSSLDGILRDIARATGMKITGGVADQRVFGTYGPAAPSQVIGALLEGSGCNSILRVNTAHEPTELVLTPMQGSPSPPDLNQPPAAAASPRPQPYSPPPAAFGAPSGAAYAPSIRPQYAPPQPEPVISQPAAPSTPEQQPIAPAAAGTSPPSSPNGVLTPQQIYEQLQRLQQQQAQPAAGPR